MHPGDYLNASPGLLEGHGADGTRTRTGPLPRDTELGFELRGSPIDTRGMSSSAGRCHVDPEDTGMYNTIRRSVRF
jgi:hypothetical protein